MRISAATGTMAPIPAHGMSIRTPLRIRIRILAVAASVTIIFIALLMLRHIRRTNINGQLNCPATANTLRGPEKRRVGKTKGVSGIFGAGF